MCVYKLKLRHTRIPFGASFFFSRSTVSWMSLPVMKILLRTAVLLGYCILLFRWWHWWLRTRLPVQETSETWFQSLGWEDPLEENRAARCSILACRIPGAEEPGGLR